MSGLKSVFDFFYPPECLACSCFISDAGTLCSDCFNQLVFVQGHVCECCGYPLENAQEGQRCGPCLAKSPLYTLRTPLCYNDLSKELVLKLKYFDRMDLAKPLASFLYPVIEPFLEDIDYILPVPLHWRRLWSRRYNQATELCHHLSHSIAARRDVPIPVLTNLLLRTKYTEPQGLKSYLHRTRNMRGAFHVHYPEILKGKSVALIDDVYTTGATLKACAKALSKASVRHIYAFTVTRVIKGEALTP